LKTRKVEGNLAWLHATLEKNSQAWLLAVRAGHSDPSLPDDWLEQREALLRAWPVSGHNLPGIKRNDRIVYFAIGRKKVIAVGRATGDLDKWERRLPVQIYAWSPQVQFSFDFDDVGIDSKSIVGAEAFHLETETYEATVRAFMTADTNESDFGRK